MNVVKVEFQEISPCAGLTTRRSMTSLSGDRCPERDFSGAAAGGTAQARVKITPASAPQK